MTKVSTPEIRLRRARALTVAIASLVLALSVYALPFASGTDPVTYLVERPRWVLFIALGYLGGIWLAGGGLAILWALFVRHGRALSIKGGRLVYLGWPFWSVPIELIADVSPGEFRGLFRTYPGVRFQLKGGREKWLPTSLLHESPRDIAQALSALH